MKDGQILKQQLEIQGIKPTEAAKILGKSSRISIYNYFKVETLKDQTIDEIKEKLGIDIPALRNSIEKNFYSNVVSGNSNVVVFSMEAAISEIYKEKNPTEVIDFRVVSDNMEPTIERNSVIRSYEIRIHEIKNNDILIFLIRSNYILSRYKIVDSRLNISFDNSSQKLTYEINDIEKIYAIHCLLSFNFTKTIDLIRRISNLESKVDQLIK